jgi:hypothetical protein
MISMLTLIVVDHWFKLQLLGQTTDQNKTKQALTLNKKLQKQSIYGSGKSVWFETDSS